MRTNSAEQTLRLALVVCTAVFVLALGRCYAGGGEPKTSNSDTASTGTRGEASAKGRGAEPAPANRWALLVGVDAYLDGRLGKLSYCGADVQTLRDLLVEQAGFPADQVLVLNDKQEDRLRQPLRQAIERNLRGLLAQTREGDLVVVSFSGHGLHIDGTSYLCPADADMDQSAATMIPVSRLYEMLQNDCKAAQKIVLVDACRSNPKNRRGPEDTMAKALAESVRNVPEGLLVLASCRAEQASFEDADVKHGVFMHYVLDGLSGKADERGRGLRGNGDGVVDLDELFNYASGQTGKFVLNRYAQTQTPEMYGVRRGPIDLIRLASIPQPALEPRRSRLASQPKEITNSIGMKLALIPAGEFMMGSPEDEEKRSDGEGPQHRVRITKPFYLGKYEVTQEEYEKLMGENPSNFKGARLPVERVSWEDAVKFCERLSQKEGREYRLPTEAEWEYACRAGTTTPFSFGRVLNGREANCDGNYPYGTEEKGPYLRRTKEVGAYAANAFGLHDMHGNVWEWCSDWFDSGYYANSPVDDPTGPPSGSYRMTRGGGWGGDALLCRSAYRYDGWATGDGDGPGFRVRLIPAATRE